MTPDRRTRVLFIAEAVTLAHVARAHALASGLDASRFEVHAAWDPRYNHLLGELPYPFHPIRSLASEVFLERLARGAPMHDAETLRAYVREDLDTIRAVGPDAVVGDFRLSLAASARIARVPHIAVANAYWSPYGRQTFLFPHYDYPGRAIVGNAASRWLFSLLRPVGFAMHTRPLNRVLRDYGLPGIGGDIREMYTFGDRTAYAGIRELVPLDNLPPTHQYIGPVLWSPAVDPPEWWDDLPADRPIVYVTPGSSGESSFLPVVLNALSELPVTTIAATAGRAQISSPPANAWLADFLPGPQAAKRSALVVCNGGSPTTTQALTAGVPVLGIVSNNMDQQLNMEAVVRAGAGEALKARGLTTEAVEAAARRLLEAGEARRAAQRLATGSQALQPAEGLARLITELLSAGKNPS